MIRNPQSAIRTHRRHIMICAALAALCAIIYGQTLTFDFLHYDDDKFITGNPELRAGLTWQGIVWAFTTNRETYYIPITWLTHLFDYQVYGLRPWGHHLTNAIFHAVNTALLFLVLMRMTRQRWPSALVAALFAAHPLHVESVAWISERKDVVSTLFWFLTLDAYTRYSSRPNAPRYTLVFLLLALGLMAKPMLITVPFMLLLLDYWPLDRGRRRWTWLVVEKIPLILLALAFTFVTAVMTRRGVKLLPTELVPWGSRLTNAAVSYPFYLFKMVCPVNIVEPYPYPPMFRPWWQVGGAFALLIGVTGAVIAFRRRCPYLIVGWLTYLGVLMPVNGLVQATGFRYANRYTYVSLIGIFIMIAWGLASLIQARRVFKKPVAAAMAAILAILTVLAVFQTRHWRDSLSLFTHAVEATQDNAAANYALANECARLRKQDKAEAFYREALRISPGFLDAHINYGDLLAEMGRPGEAAAEYEAVLQRDPGSASAHANLGMALAKLGRSDQAVAECNKALEIDPNCAKAHNNLAIMLAGQAKYDDAISHYRDAIRGDPEYAMAHYNLGTLLAKLGRTQDAVFELAEAVRIDPANAAAHFNLATVLTALGKQDDAVPQYLETIRLDPFNRDAYVNLGVAMALQKRFEDAARYYRKALEIDPGCVKARADLAKVLAALGRNDEIRQAPSNPHNPAP